MLDYNYQRYTRSRGILIVSLIVSRFRQRRSTQVARNFINVTNTPRRDLGWRYRWGIINFLATGVTRAPESLAATLRTCRDCN